MRFPPNWAGTLSLLTCLSPTLAYEDDLENANHIFNAIQSTMRHHGSEINYNGMSFYRATVPKGTKFYHGTGLKDPIQGMEWLAFKPEHSLGFAHRSGNKFFAKKDLQQPLDEFTASDQDGNGYLHTYAAARDLRLLYVDGMSAGPGDGKESQDRILYNNTITGDQPVGGPKIGGPPQEQQRAIEACRMAKEDWDDRIDGIVRTEGDFEIILCNFDRDLDVVHITQTKPQEYSGHPGPGGPGGGKGRKGHGPGPGGRGPRSGIKYWSLAARFDERLGKKVQVDLDDFVSAYTYGLDLFPGDGSVPTVSHIPVEDLQPIRKDVFKMLNTWNTSIDAFDWQAVADAIVFLYSDELKTLATGNFTSAKEMRDRIEGLMEPFVDYRDFYNGEVIIHRCAAEWIPHSAPVGSLGGNAVRSVARSVCSTLVSVLMDEQDLETSVKIFKDLVSYLQWTTWAEDE
ncbi:hypothetical protein N7520_004866 [Penicillium odoratum]|uniref:uncharacterized protein n=1 Tax=Penicillium odoratum TaxID=1167516 RepID=UPI0025475502|nr:uncharacterized protein N7520_004866 [Penicillium odoratum]KAJ5765307.1 hypothetical protein N7520_004866 [Penicillium odoratum]